MSSWDKELEKHEQKLRNDLEKHGFVESEMHPDYLGTFYNNHASLSQFYKWVDGKYMIRIGADFPKIFAIQDMTWNVIFYNGAHSWGRFLDIQAIHSDDYIQPIIDFAEREYNFYKEHEKDVDTQKNGKTV